MMPETWTDWVLLAAVVAVALLVALAADIIEFFLRRKNG